MYTQLRGMRKQHNFAAYYISMRILIISGLLALLIMVMAFVGANVLGLLREMSYSLELWVWWLFFPLSASICCTMVCWFARWMQPAIIPSQIVRKAAQLSFILALPFQYLVAIIMNLAIFSIFGREGSQQFTLVFVCLGCWFLGIVVASTVLLYNSSGSPLEIA